MKFMARFNGAATDQSRKYQEIFSFVTDFCSCFNGAATDQSRKWIQLCPY